MSQHDPEMVSSNPHQAFLTVSADVYNYPTHRAQSPQRRQSSRPETIRSVRSTIFSKLSYLDAFALLVSMQIGSGIFVSTSQVNQNAAGPGFAIILWVLCGLLAWSGATCFAELGVSLPLNGGTQEYLRYIFGDGLAFTTAWLWIMAVRPCSIAIQAITFAQYWIITLFGEKMPQDGWQAKVLALLGFYVVVMFNMVSIKMSVGIIRFFTMIKLTAVLLLVVFTVLSVGFHVRANGVVPSRDWLEKDWFNSHSSKWDSGAWNVIGQSTVGIYAGLWAYSGYDSANYVAGDIKDPSRNLPLALNTAEPVVMTLFVLANVCYYLTVSWSDINTNDAIAVTLGRNVAGLFGGLVFTVLVSLACLGTINVNVLTTSRQVVSAAQANWLPRGLDKYSSLFTTIPARPTSSRQPLLTPIPEEPIPLGPQVPIRALIFNAVITTAFIAFGTFGSLVTFIGLCEYSFFSITAFGILVLRRREPDLPRPYRPWIGIPIIFCIVGGCLVVVGCTQAPVQAGIIVALIIVGYIRLCAVTAIRTRRIMARMNRREVGTLNSYRIEM